jgi:hypothetical protein
MGDTATRDICRTKWLQQAVIIQESDPKCKYLTRVLTQRLIRVEGSLVKLIQK